MYEENFISRVEYDKTSGGSRTYHVFGFGCGGCHSLQKPNGMDSESSRHRRLIASKSEERAFFGPPVCYQIHVIISNVVLSIYNIIERMKPQANTVGSQNAGLFQEKNSMDTSQP